MLFTLCLKVLNLLFVKLANLVSQHVYINLSPDSSTVPDPSRTFVTTIIIISLTGQWVQFVVLIILFCGDNCHQFILLSCVLQENVSNVLQEKVFPVTSTVLCPVSYRNICHQCKCRRELHDIYHANFVDVRERVGWEDPPDPLLRVNKEQTLRLNYTWVPPGLSDDKVQPEGVTLIYEVSCL